MHQSPDRHRQNPIYVQVRVTSPHGVWRLLQICAHMVRWNSGTMLGYRNFLAPFPSISFYRCCWADKYGKKGSSRHSKFPFKPKKDQKYMLIWDVEMLWLFYRSHFSGLTASQSAGVLIFSHKPVHHLAVVSVIHVVAFLLSGRLFSLHNLLNSSCQEISDFWSGVFRSLSACPPALVFVLLRES